MKKYCIYCGTEHAAEDLVCRRCARELDPKENLLKDYLISKTKDKFKGTIEDNLYELIKKYLLSHLYGVVVSVSVVFLATTSVFAGGISETPVYVEEHHGNQEVVDQPVQNNMTSEEKALRDFVKDYTFIFDSDFDLNPHLADSFQRFQLPESYGYSGEFDLFDIAYTTEPCIIVKGSFSAIEADPQNPATSLGKQLVQDGYRIAQGTVERSQAYDDGQGDSKLLAENHYQVTLVLMDDQWFIAEFKETYAKGEWLE